METKTFAGRILLTVTTGRLLTKGKGDRDNGIGDLYEILSWMTSDSPYTHQLGRFADECRPFLLETFPELAAAGSQASQAELDQLIQQHKNDNADIAPAIDKWLGLAREKHGLLDDYQVPRLPARHHTVKDPVSELSEMRQHTS